MYQFQVKMNSSSDAVKAIYDVSLISNNSGVNNFKNNEIKYSLVKNNIYLLGSQTSGYLMSSISGFDADSSTGSGKVLLNQQIERNQTDYYKLRIWIDEDVNYSGEIDENGTMTGTRNSYTYSLKVKVEGKSNITNEESVDNNVVSGYLTDNEDNVLANKTLVMYSNTPQYITTTEEGYMYIENVEDGGHEIYYMGDKSIDELKQMTKEEIMNSALAAAAFTTTSTQINFDKLIKLSNFVTGNKDYLDVITIKGLDEEIKKVATGDSLTFNDLDLSNYTNVYSTNGATVSYEDNKIKVSNISNASEINVSNSLTETFAKLDSSENYILMLNNDELANTNVIEGNEKLNLDLNGKNITYNNGTIKVLGSLKVIDKTKQGTIYQDINNVFLVSGNGKLNIEYANIETLVTDKTVNDATTILMDTSCTDCDVVINDGNITNNNTSTNMITLLNNKAELTIDNGNYVGNINNADGGVVNLNNGNYSNLEKGLIINYYGTVNVKGGIFIAENGNVFQNYGLLNINDSNGKVYIKTNSNYSNSLMFSNKSDVGTKVTINGRQAYRNTENGKVYNLDACTPNPDEQDGGICLYAAESMGIKNDYVDLDIDGATIITRYIAYYQVRTGIGNIKNSYIYTFGDSCDVSDTAICSSVRNHYQDSVMTIENSEITNEYYSSIYISNKNTTNVINTNVKSLNSFAIDVSKGSNSNINIKNCNFDTESDVDALMNLVGSGTITIDGGNYINENDSVGTRKASCIYHSNGTLIVNDGIFEGLNILIETGGSGSIYIKGGKYKSTFNNHFRGSLKTSGSTNIYVSGGTFDNPNGGSVIIFQGDEESGNAYLCSANIISGNDYYNINGLAGTLYYSSSMKFSNGTNTPTGTGTLLSPNYTGTCLP